MARQYSQRINQGKKIIGCIRSDPGRPVHSRLGLTLVELAAVLIILAILVGLAIPKYMQAQRLKTQQQAPSVNSGADMRAFTTAIECYYIDYGEYPAWSSDPTKNDFALADPNKRQIIPSDQPTFLLPGSGAVNLTTPITYLPTMNYEPDPSSPNLTLSYWAPTDPNGRLKNWWIMWSTGPDNDYDLTLQNITKIHDGTSTQVLELPNWFIDITYDPTNGTMSNGDIYRVKE